MVYFIPPFSRQTLLSMKYFEQGLQFQVRVVFYLNSLQSVPEERNKYFGLFFLFLHAVELQRLEH